MLRTLQVAAETRRTNADGTSEATFEPGLGFNKISSLSEGLIGLWQLIGQARPMLVQDGNIISISLLFLPFEAARFRTDGFRCVDMQHHQTR